MAVSATVSGGGRMARVLDAIGAHIAAGGVVRVGFLEGATYPVVAKRILAGKGLSKKKRAGIEKAAVENAHLSVAQVALWDEYGTTRSKPRPFFRNMIAKESPTWGLEMAALLKRNNYDRAKVLALMGLRISEELTESIAEWPADNRPATIARKGFNKGLIDKGIMQRAPDYQVQT